MRFIYVFAFTCYSICAFSTTVKVGTVGDPPYVIVENNFTSGSSVEFWLKTAHHLKLDSEFINYQTMDQALSALEKKQVDLLIGSIAITSQLAKQYAFTQPYHQTQLGAAVLESSISHWHRIKNALTGTKFPTFLLLMLIAFIAISFLIWSTEHSSKDKRFGSNKKKGLVEAVWFALSTMTTGGYSDKIPSTATGRLVSTLWIIMSFALFSSVTASITTFITMSVLSKPQHLDQTLLFNKKIAVQDYTTGELAIKHLSVKIQETHSIPEAIARLEAGKITAVIGDRNSLKYYIKKHHDANAITLMTHLNGDRYGFLFLDYQSKYYNMVNAQIISANMLNTAAATEKKLGL